MPSWSAGPIPKGDGRFSARCCSPIDPDGRLVYVGPAGTGINSGELQRLWQRLQPLATNTMPLDAPPRPGSRFGSPLVLTRVHWVRPEFVAEVSFLTWTDDNLLRQVVYEGQREDKPAREVRREVPHTKSGRSGKDKVAPKAAVPITLIERSRSTQTV